MVPKYFELIDFLNTCFSPFSLLMIYGSTIFCEVLIFIDFID